MRCPKCKNHLLPGEVKSKKSKYFVVDYFCPECEKYTITGKIIKRSVKEKGVVNVNKLDRLGY